LSNSKIFNDTLTYGLFAELRAKLTVIQSIYLNQENP